MTILLFGATGMVGQAIAEEAARRGLAVLGTARHGTRHPVDLTRLDDVEDMLDALDPDIVVNAAAITSLDACEDDPGLAWSVNARPVAAMARFCARHDKLLVQISTDHFFTGADKARHDERAAVTLVNEYARGKYAAESFARLATRALVIRTNVTGMRGWQSEPSFAEWALDALIRRAPLGLFDDFHCSTIDAPSLARATLDLVARDIAGTINVAARTVASKRQFIHTLADALGVRLDWDTRASVKSLAVPRAESLGLDVGLAERRLGRALPDTVQVCRNLVSQWERSRCAMPLAS